VIDQPLHFIGTSHVRALEGAALHRDPSGRFLTFTALGAPLLRLLLNQCDLQVHDRSICFSIQEPDRLLAVFDQVDKCFLPMRNNLIRFLEAPYLVCDLPLGASVVLVDPLFRLSPQLTSRVINGRSCDRLYCFDGRPMTLSALSKLNDLAGDFHCYVEPFRTHLAFNRQGESSISALINALALLGSDVSVWLWRSPDFFGHQIDLDAHDALHQWRLCTFSSSVQLIPFPKHLLDRQTGSALPHYRGRPGHGNELFGQDALGYILDYLHSAS
jgi:hypothetical protein